MIDLDNTKFGTKRKAIIGGVNFNVFFSNLDVVFYVQLLDSNGIELSDLSLNQNRMVVYTVSNDKKVDTQFNIAQTGGKGEYEYFLELMQTRPLPSLIIQLANKLKSRGIFE